MSMWPAFSERGPEVTDGDIDVFEKHFDVKLPAEYRAFLRDVNGGRTARTSRRFDRGILNQLFSLNDPDESFELSEWNERVRKDIGAPELVIVGMDDGGGRILLVVDGSHRGEVWIQIHEGRLPESNPRATWEHRRDFTKLADSFEQFMLALKPLT
jgi:hypothetical protein